MLHNADLIKVPPHPVPAASLSATYGWLMVGMSFLIQAVGSGNQYMTVLLIEPLKISLHASSAAVLLATTSAVTLVIAIASPFCGILVQRYSIRNFIVIAFGAVAIGYVVLAYATTLWQVGAVYAITFSIGVLASSLAANALVSNWFVAQRGLALGVASAGIPAAGCLIPPLATYAIEQFGLAATCFTMAIAIAMLLPLVWTLVIDKPEAKGCLPQGVSGRFSPAEINDDLSTSNAWTIGKLILSNRFWIIAVVGALASGVGSVLMMNLMELAQAATFNRLTSSFFVSCEAIGAIAAAIIFGRVFDAIGQRAMAQLVIVLSAVPCLLFLGSPNQWLFGIASTLVGVSLGAALLAPNVLLAINFGRSGFALALGVMNSLMMLVLVIGIPLFGAVYDHFRSYDFALLGCLIILALTLMVAQFLPKSLR